MSANRALMIAAVLGALLAYSPVRQAETAYEDEVYLRPATTPTSWSVIFGPRGLTAVTFWLNPWLAMTPERTPQSYHAVNVFLHIIMGLSVYGLARVVSGDLWSAALAGAIFLLHPLASQSVAYISGRADIIAGIGTVWAAWLAASGPLTAIRGLLILLAVLVAVGGKEPAIMAAPLAAFVLLWQGKLRWSWRLAGCAAGALAVLGVVLIRTVQVRLLDNDYLVASEHGLFGYVAMQSVATWRYLALIIWPVGFTVDHDFDGMTRWVAVTSLVLGLAVVGAAISQWHRHPAASFAAGWMVLTLFPRFVVPIPEYLNEHQFYTALVGPCLALPIAISHLDQWMQQKSAPCMSNSSGDHQ